MSGIDWRKAPEWAECVIRSSDDELGTLYWAEPWGTIDGKRCVVGSESLRLDSNAIANTAGNKHSWILVVSRPVIWSGEGLPPVGTVCEWHPNQDGWVKVEILGHNGEETWFRRDGHTSSETCLRMAFFRPIRTPEQIADENREKAARELFELVNPEGKWHKFADEGKTRYRAAIDAGYCKQAAK